MTQPLELHPLPTPEEVLAALETIPHEVAGVRRRYKFVNLLSALFPAGDPRLQRPAGQPHGRHYSPAYRFMLDVELGKIVPGLRGGSGGWLWRD